MKTMNIKSKPKLKIILFAMVIIFSTSLVSSAVWDISTATYDNVNISSYSTTPEDIFFKSDGTKFYEAKTSGIYQHSCTDAWNISSCSYDWVSIIPTGYGATGVFFKSDGSKLYYTDTNNYKIYELDCGTNWVLNTCSYNDVYITTQDLIPQDIFFKSDGTKLYEVGSHQDKIYQYNCSDAWNLSSCSYDDVNISTQSSPQGMSFSSDGTKVYNIDDNADKVYQYDCTDAWNLSSCSYDSVFTSTQDTRPTGIFFKSDGSKFYEIGKDGDKIYEYNLPIIPPLSITSPENNSYYNYNESINLNYTIKNITAMNTTWYNIINSTGGYEISNTTITSNTTFNISQEDSYILNLYINDSTGIVNSTSSSFVIDLTSPLTSFYSPENDTTGYGSNQVFTFNFTDNYNLKNSYFYLWNSTGGGINELWDISTATYNNKNTTFIAEDSQGTDLWISSDGSILYALTDLKNAIYQYSLSSDWDISTATYTEKSKIINDRDTHVEGFFFKSDGTKMYVTGSDYDKVYQYNLSSAWDISTATYDKNFSITDTNPVDVHFKSDGTKMYVVGLEHQLIYQYSLSSAWNISTATYDNKNFSISGENAIMERLFFNTDGEILYVSAYNGNEIYQYSLSSAWDISTATYTGKKMNCTSENGYPTGLFFKPDGSRFYVAGWNSLAIQYDLSFPVIDITGTSDSTSWEYNFISDGDYYWNAYTCDEAGNCAFNSTNQTMSILLDNNPPIITSPANSTLEYLIDSLEVDFDADETIDTWFIDDETNFSINSTGFLTNVTILEIGTYLINVSANDTIGNLNYTIYQVDVEDTTAPTITIISPTNKTYNTSTILFNATSNEVIDTWIVNYNGTNITVAIGNNLTVADGEYDLIIYGNDSFGNIGSNSSVSFNVSTDTINPNLTIIYPTNDSIISGSSDIQLNFSATDTNIDSCWYSILKSDGTTETSNTIINCSENTTFDVSVYDKFTLNLTVNDTAGNSNSSQVNFTVIQPASIDPDNRDNSGGGSTSQPVGLGTQDITENQSEEFEINKEICRMTYIHLLSYGNESSNINLLMNKLESKEMYETKLILKYWYIDRFQETCSKHILRTEQPELLCNEIYWLVTNNGWDYDDYEIFNITKRLESQIDINENIVREYVNNYEELCNNDGVDLRVIPEQPTKRNLRNGLLGIIGIIIVFILWILLKNKPTVYKR